MEITLDKAINSISHNGVEYSVQNGVVYLPDDVYAELREQLDAFSVVEDESKGRGKK